MNFECSEVRSLAVRWAKEGESALDGGTLESLRDHLSRCSQCRSRYGSLSGLIGIQSKTADTRSPGSCSLADRVMAVIEVPKKGPVRAGSFFHARAIPLAIAAAAMAVLVFATGFIAGSRMSGSSGELVSVRFTLEAPGATSVGLVGFFPESPVGERTPMTRDGNGVWSVTVRLRRDGVYSYSFLIDGKDLLPDPSAEEWVDDGFGGRDSLIRL